ncbi:MAG: carboxynorspermidine decarboxylase [Verrucomicrobiota bacterium]
MSHPLSEKEIQKLPSPCFVVDETLVLKNLQTLQSVQEATGAQILLALKAFSMFSTFPLLKKVLHGTCASSLNEARLGREEFDKEVHTYSPAYTKSELEKILPLSDKVLFNSFGQWEKFQTTIKPYLDQVLFGFRINPQHSEGQTAIYDPCAPCSRLGIPADQFATYVSKHPNTLDGITGLHFHTLCEQDSYALERTLQAFENACSPYLSKMNWINFGGGHHITRSDYNVEHLIQLINCFKEKYQVQIYLEPGEAVVLHTGFFITTVLDIISNDKQIAVLDTSAVAHLPDVLEMPYQPELVNAAKDSRYPYKYLLTGSTCLAGDLIGEYSFPEELSIGQRLIFLDMAHYTMVKTTTFNGINLPSIALKKAESGELKVVRSFSYEDFKARLS